MSRQPLGPQLLSIALLAISFAGTSLAAAPEASFAIVKRIAGPDGNWDYAIADSAARRLYIARENGVMAVNLDSGLITAQLAPGAGVRGIAQLGATGIFVSTNSGTNSAKFFEGATGKVLEEVATGKGPDAVVYEPKSGLVVVVNRSGGNATLIDSTSRAVVGTIPIGGELEFATVDDNGRVYINVASKNQVAVLDIARRKVVDRLALKGCSEPTGLAYDNIDTLLISVCANGVADFVNPKTHRQVAQISTGKIPDAVIWDVKRRIAFVPSFADGTLTIISVRGVSDIKTIQTLPTQVGTRTGALDEATGALYLPTAKMNMPTKEGQYPTPVEGTFEVFVVAQR